MSSAAISFPLLGNWSICPPNSFVLFGHTFYWYGVIIACGFLLAVIYGYRRTESFGISANDLTDLLLFSVPIGIIGARVYYVIFYGQYDRFVDMLKIWEGGLAIYGGIIFAVITIFAVSRYKKISALAVLDVVAPCLLIGQCIGRWGNFINREAFGYETNIFCRMGLTLNGETIYVHPTFLYESLWNLAGFIVMHILSKKTERKFDGQFFLYYVAWYGLGRVWIESLRTDSLLLGTTDIRVSQLIAGVSCVAAVVLLIVILKRGKYSPDKLWVNQRASLLAAVELTDDDTLKEPKEKSPAPTDKKIHDDANFSDSMDKNSPSE